MDKYFPKILIVGETFHSKSGGGITLSNLFKDWEKDNIANAIDFKHASMNAGFSNIQLFEMYKNKTIFNFIPFKVFRKFVANSSSNQENVVHSNKKNNFAIFKKTFFAVLDYTGLRHVIFKYKINSDFIEWLNKFNPDYIYCQLSSRELITFIRELNFATNIPIAIHIMDDWPTTISSKGLFKNFWHNKIDTEFRVLLNKSTIFLSISESMSEEYLKRYNKEFIPFHNPLDLNFWNKSEELDLFNHNGYVFLHAGRIGLGISDSLLMFAEALQMIKNKGANVSLHIQSSSIECEFIEKISKFTCVKINLPVQYSSIPSVMKKSDFLLICNDFDDVGESFLKFSMPTKASEYMICKRPIIIFGPKNNAVYQHALKNNLAYLIGENDINVLENKITNLLKDKILQKILSNNAYNYAKENYDALKVREKFRKIFINNEKR